MGSTARSPTQGRQARPRRSAISWYGDSVIATDAIPARLRRDAGRVRRRWARASCSSCRRTGSAPTTRSTRTSTGNWATHAISTVQIADGMYGVGGATAETAAASATIKLDAGKVTQVELYYLAQPQRRHAPRSADGEVAKIDTRGAAKKAGFAAVDVPDGEQKFELRSRTARCACSASRSRARPASSSTTWRRQRQREELRRSTSPSTSQDELAHRGADLVIIMIGANEAEWLSPAIATRRTTAAIYEQAAGARSARRAPTALPGGVAARSGRDQGRRLSVAAGDAAPDRGAAQGRAHASGCAFYETYDVEGRQGLGEPSGTAGAGSAPTSSTCRARAPATGPTASPAR